MLVMHPCTTFINRIIHDYVCSEALYYMNDNVQCALYKIVLQMYMLVDKLLTTVESNFNTHTRYRH